MTENEFRCLLESLNFNHYAKDDTYAMHYGDIVDGLVADFGKREFRWPKDMTVTTGTTSNFSQTENFVVFECVHRLLEMGYQPKDIELEPKWKVGHGASGGRADIWVRTKRPGAEEPESLLIIECKTFGKEFNSAWKDTLEDGNQLFGYFAQAPSTKFLCLYASDYANDKVVSTYHLINVQDNDEYLKTLKNPASFEKGKGTGRRNLFKAWKETYKLDYATIGLFEKGIAAYHPGKSEYTLEDLKAVDAVEIGKMYHRFAETLRKYNVSGRENAFDKLVNLMLAKVVDELQNGKLQFNWKGAAYDDDFRLQDRLQRLYKEGMQRFLGEDVTYIDDRQIDQAFHRFKNDPDATRDTVRKYVRQLKFFTNNDFAFIDVHNEKLFNQNAVVLREVVRMLQDIRLRTDAENQFLGDLFENFLDQGVKQSEGQFFTPIPFVRFMVSSLPVAETIASMGEPPVVVDYACGAGHFLNEYARQAAACVKARLSEQAAKKKGGKLPEDLYPHLRPYYDRIFGIEKEYRLSKVSKVASFMYGQDDIHIIYADALVKNDQVKDGTVNFLFTNPPYSVKGFLETLSEEERRQFRMSECVDDLAKNDDIECFFMERAAQLLAPGGMAAIVLPSSILNNGNIYVKCRDILLESFDIVAIVEMGNGTFGKTNTSTATLFLRRKQTDPDAAGHIRNRVAAWFKGDFTGDAVYGGVELRRKYAAVIGVNADDYESFLKGGQPKPLMESETFAAYRENFRASTKAKAILKKKLRAGYTAADKQKELENYVFAEIRTLEAEKLRVFMLAEDNPQPVLVVKGPTDNDGIKKFLGYEWSHRKGSEGMHILGVTESSDDEFKGNRGVEQIITPLYNPVDGADPSKINSLIRDNFLCRMVSVPNGLLPFVTISRLSEMIDFRKGDFDKSIAVVRGAKKQISSKWGIKRLGTLLKDVVGPQTKIQKSEIKESGSIPVISQESDEYVSGYVDNQEPITDLPLVVFGDHTCAVKYVDFPFVRGADGTQLIKVDPSVLVLKYLYYVLSFSDQLGAEKYERHMKYLKDCQIPVPPLADQKRLVAACEKIDQEVAVAKKEIEGCRAKREAAFEGLVARPTVRLQSVCSYVDTRIDLAAIAVADYVSTDNMLQQCEGVVPYEGVPKVDKVVSYARGDVLVSNIRPYLQKIWLADRAGGCSPDVLVIRSSDPGKCRPEYLYYALKRKAFFDFVMAGNPKGLKMPRGDKNRVMQFEIPGLPLAEQEKLVAKIRTYEDKVTQLRKTIADCRAEKAKTVEAFLK